MLSLGSVTQITLHAGFTDMRKSFNGLSNLVRNELDGDPLSGHVFGFCNKRRTLLKLIFWDGSGYCVFSKRVEKGTLSWPSQEDRVHEISHEELTMLISGIDTTNTRYKKWHRHRANAS